MQRPSATTPTQNATPFFSANIWGNTSANPNVTSNSQSQSSSRSRPGTSSGDREKDKEREYNVLTKDRDRKPSFGRRPSFSSPSKGKRRASSSNAGSVSGDQIKTDATAPPAIPPDFALAVAAKFSRDNEAVPSPASADSFSKMLSRTATTPINGQYPTTATSPPLLQTEIPSLHQHIHEVSNKRISTLDYLRKAHEGRVYWFNTLLFDKPDLARMPYFDSRKIAYRATNYLLLGLSLPAVIDLNSATPLEFLRSLNTLLAEFDSYQQIHTENGVNTSSLSRARIPNMFRRGAGGKGRRQSGAGDLYADASNSLASGSAVNSVPTSVINFGLGGEGNDLVPGEEYTHLLTPNLPFDPDFFETFATLCDVLIDCYARLMTLLPTAKDCTPIIAELFHKADSKVRKIIIQGVVKEFEDSSRVGLKQEVTNVGKVVLGGLV
ncbi:uncharacterized protein GGS22DRAFT_135418 [Annulohypoxylon maeteangense]|uniref:uncharacterized protein n=1 Tax=Annulohypoxylon maeteangense TaxID=1927788 RepID=UPI002008C237|nr:uncharacterized protein GGS22DRAFT_135418 [Annulohypoxylon maeteangense]KAI0885874.1 hypothetical protein GGS22DRAFT_135418 [Annulohypoxylon maeteangense]